MPTFRQIKWKRAEEYILVHRDETKAQQAIGADVSIGLIALVRADLVAKKLLPTPRKTNFPKKGDHKEKPAPIPLPQMELPIEGAPAKPSKPAELRDHEAMQALADMVGLDDLDDSEVHRRLLRQCLRFAFNSQLHPDTRMSASQMWSKLRDQARAKDLGPGPPLTFEAGAERLRDLMIACGPKMTLAAVNAAFDVGGDDGAREEQAAAAVGTSEAPVPA